MTTDELDSVCLLLFGIFFFHLTDNKVIACVLIFIKLGVVKSIEKRGHCDCVVVLINWVVSCLIYSMSVHCLWNSHAFNESTIRSSIAIITADKCFRNVLAVSFTLHLNLPLMTSPSYKRFLFFFNIIFHIIRKYLSSQECIMRTVFVLLLFWGLSKYS